MNDKSSKVVNVRDSVRIIDIMLVVWFGVRDTKYENITSIALT